MSPDRRPGTDQDPKPQNPQQPSQNEGGETFGNEPPVRDPKPAKRPDKYEV